MDGMISRRRFLAGAAGLAGATVMWPAGATARSARGPAARVLPLNAGWRFGGPLVAGSTEPGFDDSGFAAVTLPHCVTALSWKEWDNLTWAGDWIYRRRFDVPRELDGLRVFVDFAGAMTVTAPTINGVPLPERPGGYLPFSYELTDHLAARDNLLAVALNGNAPANIPPQGSNGGARAADYLQPAGIYRDVSLRAVPPVFVADVFAKPVDVLGAGRRVEVQCTVDGAVALEQPARIELSLLDRGRTLARASAPVALGEPGQATVTATLTGLGSVRLWDVDDPQLYDVEARLVVGGGPVHDHRTRIGFREARFELDGFFLNGRRLKIFGLNRHQIYPYTGMAMPARVQRRDAELLKRELNCNMVRTSHYVQSEHFLDACDELGLLVWEEFPSFNGGGSSAWEDLCVRDTREMVVRDRNRPSIVLWGVQVNHSPTNRDLYERTKAAAKSLDDSRQTTGAHGWHWRETHDYRTEFVQDVFGQHDYSSTPDGAATLMEPLDGVPYLVDEAIGSQTGAPYYRRTDPADVQRLQALLHAQVHEAAGSDDRHAGVLAWSAIDYDSYSGNERNYKAMKWNGVLDTFRVPKLGAAIYRAQVDPAVRPVIEPAFYWDFQQLGPGAEAMICSNCERLELYVAGEHHATVHPDRARFPHLPYAPSFADLELDGSALPELRIDGYAGGRRVLSRSFASDPAGDRLLLEADDRLLVADGSDATRVVFRAVDRHGAPRPYVEGELTFALDGPGELVGDNPFSFADNGGVGAVWIRTSGHPGSVALRAAHATLGTAEVRIAVADQGGAR